MQSLYLLKIFYITAFVIKLTQYVCHRKCSHLKHSKKKKNKTFHNVNIHPKRILLKVHDSRKVTKHKPFVWSARVCELHCPWEWLDGAPVYSQVDRKRPSWLRSLGQVGMCTPQETGEWVSTWPSHLQDSGFHLPTLWLLNGHENLSRGDLLLGKHPVSIFIL